MLHNNSLNKGVRIFVATAVDRQRKGLTDRQRLKDSQRLTEKVRD